MASGEGAEAGMVMGRRFDLVLRDVYQLGARNNYKSACVYGEGGRKCREDLTAPYFEMWRTKSAASLKSGSGTMMLVRGWCSSSVVSHVQVIMASCGGKAQENANLGWSCLYRQLRLVGSRNGSLMAHD